MTLDESLRKQLDLISAIHVAGLAREVLDLEFYIRSEKPHETEPPEKDYILIGAISGIGLSMSIIHGDIKGQEITVNEDDLALYIQEKAIQFGQERIRKYEQRLAESNVLSGRLNAMIKLTQSLTDASNGFNFYFAAKKIVMDFYGKIPDDTRAEDEAIWANLAKKHCFP